VQEHVSALAINPQIEAAAVYGSDQRLVAAFARNRAQPLSQSLTRADLGTTGDRTIVAVPVSHDTERLGMVLIRSAPDPIVRRLARHVAMMLLAVMAALFLGFMGTAQRTLHEANRQLESRAVTLAETNRLLHNEMDERGKAEEALRQSQKMEAVGRLAGGVAHDFNNLLTIIQGNLHLLRKIGAVDPNAAEAYVAGANHAAERAGNLVRSLLAFSRRQPLSPRPVDLNELATGIDDLISHSVGDRVRIEWDLRARWKTLCDVNQMENVILNIAINARDAMPDGGTLTIRTTDCANHDVHDADLQAGDYVELTMRDTGTGMTEEVRRRAIDPFFTTKPHGRGTGLGLSTAFAFIRQSKGHLRIDTVPGKGTAIVILMPRFVEAGETA
jgi:signal transduction histidine kinase